MKYVTARFPLLQFLDLKCCYAYLSTSLEAVNDDTDALSHQDLHMRCKHLSLHSNCKVYVVPAHAMQYIFIIINLGTRWSVVTPQDVAILLPWTSDTCTIVCWIGANAGVNGLENTKTSFPLWHSKPESSS